MADQVGRDPIDRCTDIVAAPQPMRAHAREEKGLASPREKATTKVDRAADLKRNLEGVLALSKRIWDDGTGTTEEGRVLIAGLTALVGLAAAVSVDAATSDGAFQLMGILANTADPSTAWFGRRSREITESLEEYEEQIIPTAMSDLSLMAAE